MPPYAPISPDWHCYRASSCSFTPNHHQLEFLSACSTVVIRGYRQKSEKQTKICDPSVVIKMFWTFDTDCFVTFVYNSGYEFNDCVNHSTIRWETVISYA